MLINSIFLSFLKYKTTLVALVISLCFYFTLSNKIWIINITGDSQTLNEFIKNELLENKIYIGAKKIDNTKLSEIQKKILFENFDVIEYLSLKNNGSCIDATYKIKRVENEKNKYKKSLYASKDGMIKSFDILSGEKVVEVNDYVKKGDLFLSYYQKRCEEITSLLKKELSESRKIELLNEEKMIKDVVNE